MTTVSVIVPVYDGARTVAATLRSVLNQTCRDIEIIVVDDGSTDDSADIVRRAAADDSRIALLCTENRGVAAARNRGIAHASGEFVAPLDADDLWHPRKLDLQIKSFSRAGSDTVLVYNWFAPIGAQDQLLVRPKMPVVEGAVYYRHLDYNFISNGSTPLIRRAALDGLQYDTGLAAQGVGGCEDYLLQLQLALRGRFACMPAFLTGYRKAGGSMSSQVGRMIRSHMHVLEQMREYGPRDAGAVIDRRMAEFAVELARHRLRRGQIASGFEAIGTGLRSAPIAAVRHMVRDARAALGRKRGTNPETCNAASPVFPPSDPFASIGDPLPPARLARLAPLALRDRCSDYLR